MISADYHETFKSGFAEATIGDEEWLVPVRWLIPEQEEKGALAEK